MPFVGSHRAATYLYVNYLLTAHENRKVDEKLVLAIRRETLSLAKIALLKTVEQLLKTNTGFLDSVPGLKVCIISFCRYFSTF